ncbi:MAG TPA: ORF6N domain-containing protein [Alicyclobacillus sp.]|nr:ORF6N domain-containing protein [Alicyclobacillus sp.]
MSNIVVIEIAGETNEIEIKEYRGQRVVTFKDVDRLHRRPEGTARKRFNDNRKRFVEGVDFFAVPRRELRPEFGRNSNEGNPNIEVILLTESGYLMIVKTLGDDLAWEVQRALVNSYFRAKQLSAPATEDPKLQIQRMNAEARLRHAKAQELKVLQKVLDHHAEVLSPAARQAVVAYMANAVAEREIIPLPTVDKQYTATEIAVELGVSPQFVGRVSERRGLKIPEHGIWVLDKSPNSDKQVTTFRYNEKGRQKLIEAIREEKGQNK